MNRLTTKTSIMGNKHDLLYGRAYIWKEKLKDLNYHVIEKAIDKLGQLENVEEALGIELCILFDIISGKQKIYIEEELFKNTSWGKNWKEVKCFICNSFDYTFIYCDCWDEENFQGRTHTEVIPIKDYKKTWSLAGEDLENE